MSLTSTDTEKEKQVVNQPDWVLRKPSSNSFYIGIGNAPLSDPNYHANAKLEALDDLASEISVTVASQSLLSQIENQSGFREQFQSAIKSTTQQSVELHEQVDSWSDDRYYWVQYRLDKYQYQKLKKEKKQTALNISKEYFDEARKAEEDGNIVQSLHLYAQAIEALGQYVNEQNEVIIDGKPAYLDLNAYTKIVDIISGTSLKSDTLTYYLKSSEEQKNIRIQAKWKSQNVGQLPVAIQKRDYSEKYTNEKGELKLVIYRKEALKELRLISHYDFLEAYPITFSLVSSIKTVPLVINFVTPAITVEVLSQEQNLGQSTHQKSLSAFIKQVFTEEGYQVVNENANYKVEVNANTREGGELSGLFTTYLDFTLDIRNSKEETVFSDSWSGIKGIHTSYKAAGMKAYQNLKSNISEEVKRSINENFINKN